MIFLRRLTEAEKASMRAQKLTQQLLTFSKGGMPVKQIADIADIVRQTAGIYAHWIQCSRGDEFSRRVCGDVNVDRGQFSQVIQNLVVLNAKQSMPDGGIIEYPPPRT